MANITEPVLLIDNLDLFVPSGIRVLRIIFVMTVALLGLIGNCLVASVMYKVKQKNSTDYLVFAMSVVDLYCSTVLGFTFFCRSHFECWDLISSDSACRFHYVSISIGNVSSSMLLTMVAIDRYFKTCKPLSGRLTGKQSKISISVVMLSCALVSLPNLFYSWNTTLKACTGTPGFEGFLQISNIFAISLFLIMFVTVVFAYAAVYSFLKRRQSEKGVTFLLAQRTVFARNNKVAADTMGMAPRNLQTVGINSNLNVPTEQLNERNGTLNIANANREVMAVSEPTRDKPSRDHIQSIFTVATPGSSRQLDTDETSSGQQKNKKHEPVSKMAQIRKTCRMMAFITVIFIASWLTSLCSGILWISIDTLRSSVASRSVIYLLGVLYMINCISNPFLYFKMSSVFRQRLIKLIFEK